MNISTTVAFVLAACGVPVAKHGNRGASGRCGGADLLAALDIPIAPHRGARGGGSKSRVISELPAKIITQTLAAENLAFLYAPLFHPAMKKLAAVRKKIGRRTILNLLGPLCNPLSPAIQLIGVPSREVGEKMAHAAATLGIKRALVVTGENCLDEIIVTGKTTMFHVGNKRISKTTFDPATVGMADAKTAHVSIGTPTYNAQLFTLLLKNKAPKEFMNLLLINAAFGLKLYMEGITLREALEKVRTVIENGAAYKKFVAYKALSKRLYAKSFS